MDKDKQGSIDAEQGGSKTLPGVPNTLVFLRAFILNSLRATTERLHLASARLTCRHRMSDIRFVFVFRYHAFKALVLASGIIRRYRRGFAHHIRASFRLMRESLPTESALQEMRKALPLLSLRLTYARWVRTVLAWRRCGAARLKQVQRPEFATPLLRFRLGSSFLLGVFLVALLLHTFIPSSAQTTPDQNDNSYAVLSLARAFLFGDGGDNDVNTPVKTVNSSERPMQNAIDPDRFRTTNVCDRSGPVRDVIVESVAGINDCSEVSASHLSEITTLDLSGKGITALRAGDLSGLSGLRLLNLGENRLNSLPGGLLDGLPQLRFLYLNDNNLRSLPGNLFAGLSKLEVLYLYGNSLDTLAPETFHGSTALRELNLTDNSLSALPIDLFDPLAKLEILRLGWNRLTVLPDELFERLVSLKYLNVFGNPGIGGTENATFAEVSRSQTADQAQSIQDTSDVSMRKSRDVLMPDMRVPAAGIPTDEPPEKAHAVFARAEKDAVETLDSFLVAAVSTSAPASAETDPVKTDDEPVAGTNGSVRTFKISYGATQIPFTRPFTPDSTSYSAWVPSTVDIVTLEVETESTDAKLLIVPHDVDENPENGYQVMLDEESVTLISVTVVGTDGQTLRTYMASVIRQGPIICWLPYTATATAIAAAATMLGNDSDTRNFEPSFGFATGMRSLAENTGDATSATAMDIGLPVLATDIDGDALTYSLEGPDAARFAIVESTGQITSKAGVNYDHEATPRQSITVAVNDGKGGYDTIEITMLIADVNEPPLAPGKPVVTSVPGSKTSLAVSWTAPSNAGRPVIQDYSLQYRAGNSGNWATGLEHATGTSTTISGLDNSTAYQVQVRATNDEGDGPWSPPGSGQPSPNSPPVFDAETASRSLIENIGVAATTAAVNLGEAFTATDLDREDTLTYSLAGANTSYFDLDPTTGQLKTRVGVNYDHESTPSLPITVKVSDDDGGSDTIAVTVNVEDDIEPPLAPGKPVVTPVPGSKTSLAVSWTAPFNAGRPVIQSYSLQFREANGSNWSTGPQLIGTRATISDLSEDTAYQVQVRATNDEGDGPWSEPGIGRTQRGNRPPEFASPTTTRSLYENYADATTTTAENVGAPITATDPDSDTLLYSLSGTYASLFTIDPDSGQLKTRVGVNYSHESITALSVTVKASDGNGASDTIDVTVTVNDIDEPPMAPEPPAVDPMKDSMTSLSVSWSPPYNMGRPDIEHYDLRYRNGATADWNDGPQDQYGTNTVLYSLKEGSKYQVQVRASNHEGDGPWSALETAQTNTAQTNTPVRSNNNNAPEFGSETATRSMTENTGSATTAVAANLGDAITATDDDNDSLTYSIEGPNANAFTIASDSGQLKTKVGVNYSHESTPTLSVTVRVRDGRGGTDTIAVTVTVNDLNEPPLAPAAPTVSAVSGSSANLSISWNPPSNTGRPSITGYDLQFRPGTTGDWLNGPQNVTSTSAIFSNLEPDSLYQVQVRAKNDEGDGSYSAPGSGRTNAERVIDPSNNAPEFTSTTANRSLDENVGDATTSVAGNLGSPFTATDEDSTDTLNYSLEGSNASSFGIDTVTGQLKTKVGVNYDHEATPTLSVTVRASDGAGASDTIDVTVTVADKSEPPKAPAAPAVSAVAGSITSLSVTWIPPSNTGRPSIDSYDLQYRAGTTGSWLDGPQNVSGTSSTLGSLEPNSLYQVQVRATNNEGDGPYSSPGSGRTSPNNLPEFAGASASRSLTENVGDATTSTSTNLGAAFTATDDDNDTVSYRLAGTNASSFEIDANTGQLKTKVGVNYDHEATPTLSVTVVAEDTRGGSKTIAVTITVNDLNEPPLAPGQPVVSAVSGSSTSLSVSWTAPGNAGRPNIQSYDLQYREGDSGDWNNGPQNVSRTNSSISSLKAGTSYQVQVLATNAEGDGPYSSPGSGSTNAPINSGPQFASNTATRSLDENTGDATETSARNLGAAFTATDDDTLTYSIEGTHASSFTIDDETGQLKTKVGINYSHEATHTMSVTVKATDTSSEGDTIDVTVTINDVDEPPLAPTVTGITSTETGMTVSWQAPANTGRPDILSYDLQYKKLPSGSWRNGPQDREGTSATIASLEPSTSYQVKVRAYNNEGHGPYSTAFDGQTKDPPPPNCSAGEEGEFRLVNGSSANEGRLEVCHDQKWGTICDDYWTTEEATVACRDLGYTNGAESGGVKFLASGNGGIPYFGAAASSVPIWLDDIQCSGDESSLLDCEVAGGGLVSNAWGESNCKHTEDVGMRCRTGSGRIIAPDAPLTPMMSVEDARATEGGNLSFLVSLSSASTEDVTVSYTTLDGTAKAEEDYTPVSHSLSFTPGDTTKTIEVSVLEDGIDEGKETLTLRLTNPDGALLENATATGTIENGAATVLAWTTRFGRMVASQVVDAVSARMDVSGDSYLAVGNMRLGGRGSIGMSNPSSLPWISSERNTRHRGEPYALHAQQILSGSGFYVSSEETTDSKRPGFAAWGRVSTSGFEAELDNILMDGRTTTGLVGLDASWKRLTAGVLISQSYGKGSYALNRESVEDENEVESSLTGFYPSAWLKLNQRVSLWGLAGIGTGGLTLRQQGEAQVETDLDMRMGALGIRSRITGGGFSSGLALAIKSDAMWVRTATEATTTLSEIQGDVTRIRLLLEGSHSFRMGEGATFTPSGEVGVRHDGGDAETGTGLEMGAGLRYAIGSLIVEGSVRTLVLHEDDGYREWGASGAIRYSPAASDRGLSLSVSPAWGNTTSASSRLWSARDASLLSHAGSFEGAGRLEAELGYGMDLLGTGDVFTPFASLSLEEEGRRRIRTGAMWKVAQAAALSIEGTRIGTRYDDNPIDAILLRATFRF